MVTTAHLPGLPAERVAELSKASRWVGPLHLTLEWGLIVGCVAWARWWGHPVAVVLAIFWIGARQHALLALAHEAAHGRLLRPLLRGPSAEFLGEALTAWPLLASVRSYRRIHMAHHRHLGTHGDPDWARNRPDRWGDTAPFGHRLRHLLGLQANQRSLLAMFVGGGELRDAGERRWGLVRVLYYAAVAFAITWLGAWPVVGLYWFLPLVLWTTVLMRLRGISEHWAVGKGATGTGTAREASETRTLLLSPLGRMLFLPKNMGYHLEHHLYPGVSFHRLPQLHRELNALPGYAERAHVTRGVPALLAEVACFRRDGTPRRSPR